VTTEEKALMAELYADGLDMHTIAAVLDVHRTTVAQYLRQAGVTLRRAGVPSAVIPETVRLYGDGWSTAQLAERYGCDPVTVRQTSKRAGVAMRPRRGWQY
jgi:DNA-directed RNA polymerase specialized sigma24 family protein